MDRRDFMKAATTLLATTALQRTDFAQGDVIIPGRLVLPMNRGWRYNSSFVAGGHDLNFDDSKFDARGGSAYQRCAAVARI